VTTQLLGEAPPAPEGSDAGRILGLRCRACGRAESLGPSYVCPACFGPLEVDYDLDVVAQTLNRASIAARPAGTGRPKTAGFLDNLAASPS